VKSKDGGRPLFEAPHLDDPRQSPAPLPVPEGEHREYLLREYWIALARLNRWGYSAEEALSIMADVSAGKIDSLRYVPLKEEDRYIAFLRRLGYDPDEIPKMIEDFKTGRIEDLLKVRPKEKK
jgi:hypothetical protein